MKSSRFSRLPDTVRYDARLTPFQKILYSEIDLLSIKQGCCFATNKYLAKVLSVHDRHISKSLSGLSALGYIRFEACPISGNRRQIFLESLDDLSLEDISLETEAPPHLGYADPTQSGLGVGANMTGDISPNAEAPTPNGNDPNYIGIRRNNYTKELDKGTRVRARTKPATKPFVPPTLSEVEAYIQENGLSVDAQKFIDYYTAGDWVDGKGNKVKNWKQKLLTWAGYNSGSSKAKTSKSPFEGQAINYDEE